jgi:CRISPR-associated protein Cas5, subtype I-C/DVULG
MDYIDKEYCLEIWGPMACFTRPEMKVERVSYDVITPSAARAIFEAIFWKPAISWEINKIEVLNPIKWDSVRRNEVGAVAQGKRVSTPIFIEDKRQQRNTLLLKDVHYRIYATLKYTPPKDRKRQDSRPRTAEERQSENPGKYQAMFERRAMKGQCFNQPYLGCREFSLGFRLIINSSDGSLKKPIAETKDLGIMLYDLDFDTSADNPSPMFYRAKMNNGTIIVPSKTSKEVLR